MSAVAVPNSVGRAPGKVILLGEHAVVHGGWALALPWPAVEVTASVSEVAGDTQVVSDVPGMDLAGLTAAARAVCATGYRVSLRSTVPPGSGLGSSASTALAVVRAMAQASGATVDEQALADVAERHAHGRPSGLDVATVAASGLILFKRGEAVRPVASAVPAFVVADSGVPRNAGEAIAAVNAGLAQHQALVDALGQAALAGVTALEAGDLPLLGRLLDQAHERLTILGVGHPALDVLVAAARAAGALGAKLTGAGRGGCVVALAADPVSARAIALALLAAGAARAWTAEGPA